MFNRRKISKKLNKNIDPSIDFLKQTKRKEKMRQMKNLEIFHWCWWIAWKIGEEIQGLDPWLLKLRKIQGLDLGLLLTVNTNSGSIADVGFGEWEDISKAGVVCPNYLSQVLAETTPCFLAYTCL